MRKNLMMLSAFTLCLAFAGCGAKENKSEMKIKTPDGKEMKVEVKTDKK